MFQKGKKEIIKKTRILKKSKILYDNDDELIIHLLINTCGIFFA